MVFFVKKTLIRENRSAAEVIMIYYNPLYLIQSLYTLKISCKFTLALQNTSKTNITIMKKVFLLLLIITLFTSCSTTTATAIPQYFESPFDGMVVGTLAFENKKPIFNKYIYRYQAEGDRKIRKHRVLIIRPHQIWKIKFEPDFTDKTKAVYLFAIREARGKYTFTYLKLNSNYGYASITHEIPLEHLGFTIEKGKVKYIGEIYYDSQTNTVSISDQKERDLPEFKERFPNLIIE